MKQFSHVATAVAAAACLASVAEARRSPFFARNNERSWQPAVETAAAHAAAIAGGFGHGDRDSLSQMAMGEFVGDLPEPPATTAAPALDPKFLKRDSSDNTCAYVSGISSVSLYCDTTDECVANSIISYVGCCPDTSTTCPIPTTCYASSDGDLYTTSNGRTLWCGNSEYPECVTHYYADDVFTGYTLLGCGKTEAVDKVWYLPTSDSSSSSTTTHRRTTTSSSIESTSSSMVSVSSSSPPTPSPTPPPVKKSNTGAIAGGVVGGVAGLALIGAGVFFLLRRNSAKKAAAAGGAGGAAGAPGAAGVPPGGQPPMGQQPYYSPVPGADPSQPGPGGYAAAGMAGGMAGAGVAGYQHDQYNNQYAGQYPGQVQSGSPPLNSPPMQQQNIPQQHDAKVYDPYNPQGQQYDPNAVRGSVAGVSSIGSPMPQSPGQISPHETVTPFSAPPPQPGMGFHSGPVPTTLDVAELPTERGHGELRELA